MLIKLNELIKHMQALISTSEANQCDEIRRKLNFAVKFTISLPYKILRVKFDKRGQNLK